jgi:integrase
LNLTVRKIEALKAKPYRYEIADSEVRGLHVRVSPHGTKSFVLVTRYPGAKHPARRSLGIYGDVTLAEAREKAREWRSMVAKGVDPKAEAKRLRLAEAMKNKNTVGAVAEAFIAAKISKMRCSKQATGEIRREIISRWAERPITEITRSDVVSMVREIGARAPYSARNVFAWTRAMFNWAISEDVYNLTMNPTSGIDADDKIGSRRKPRDRILTDAELRALWRATGKMEYPAGPVIRLLLLTGCRRAEIADAKWSEFDPNDRVLRIPGARTKTDNGQHVVPLSTLAMDLINGLPRINGSPYMFSVSGVSPMVDHSGAKLKLDELMAEELGCSPRDFARGGDRSFVIHDLRRTVRSRLAALKVDFTVAELILGHALGGIHATYNRHTYDEEKREALQRWADHLQAIIGGR